MKVSRLNLVFLILLGIPGVLGIIYSMKICYTDPELYNYQGLRYFQKGNYKKAIEKYTRALYLNPNFAVAHNNLGRVYLKMEEYDEAEEKFKQAVELTPIYSKAHNNLAIIYFKKALYDKAIEEYKKALELISNEVNIYTHNEASIYTNLGSAYFRKGDFSNAREYWERALKISPGYPPAQKNLDRLRGIKRIDD